jgi:hypothetical protein
MFKLTVQSHTFECILNGETEIIPIEDNVNSGEIFIIEESGKQKRQLYAKANECIHFDKAVQVPRFEKFPYLFHKWIREPFTIVRLHLTGMMNIDGDDVPMTEPSAKEIYKNVDVDNVINLKNCPTIICKNNRHMMLCELVFTEFDFDKDKKRITNLYYEVNEGKKRTKCMLVE